VRGHWRELRDNAGDVDMSRIGKDRAGEYVVAGHTWVNSFVKNDIEKGFIKKI